MSIKKLPEVKYIAPLRCWDVYAQTLLPTAPNCPVSRDERILRYLGAKHKWQGFPALRQHTYEALILTDQHNKIIWVNAGFKKMTGYTPHNVIGRSPKILQGQLTSPQALKRFSALLKKEMPFTTKILNYRKNQSTYICEIEVFPLRNQSGEISHHLALEKEL
ncbi:hypothetical protein GCM10007049_17830 [Echinicola pacifica]|uniref:PAS domain-containing protein n=1 Tax=Echinicola pacifica TaxID=346377 RepID=A0A918UP71_9BACT|nr:PAS domain-containing protein [Echinicola pacifica]GGZ25718.1 hypothetical protein GCM10007049_17830 [Echinicola pacifica]